MHVPQHQSPLQIGNYALGQTIGMGSFGKVKRASHIITGISVAVKIIDKKKLQANEDMGHKVEREIYSLKRFRHPHIIKLYEVIETQTDVFLIMEHAGGGEIFDYIVNRGRLSEQEARFFFRQLVSAVNYCHVQKVAHRDLKPENLLLSATYRSLKIADFGLSNIMQDGDFLKTSCGSPNYAAPEVINGVYYSGKEADIWSCGIILYTFLTACLPFDDASIPRLFSKIKKGVYTVPTFLSQSCQDLIRNMLHVDPLHRITIPEIMEHPWFKDDLPIYISVVNPEMQMQEDQVIHPDKDVLNHLANLYHMPVDELLSELQGTTCGAGPTVEWKDEKKTNPYVVSYYLLADQRSNYRLNQSFTKYNSALSNNEHSTPERNEPVVAISPYFNLREEIPFLELDSMTYSTDVATSFTGCTSQAASGEYSLAGGGNETEMSNPEHRYGNVLTLSRKMSKSESEQTLGCTHPWGTRRYWYLGLLSSKKAETIMKEIYRVLKKLGFEWKVISFYQVKVRIILPDSHPIQVKRKEKISGHDQLSSDTPNPLAMSAKFSNENPHQQKSFNPMFISGSNSKNCTYGALGMSEDSYSGVKNTHPFIDEDLVSRSGRTLALSTSEALVVLMVQLFKISPKNERKKTFHLIDIKKHQGHPIAFFEICGSILEEADL